MSKGTIGFSSGGNGSGGSSSSGGHSGGGGGGGPAIAASAEATYQQFLNSIGSESESDDDDYSEDSDSCDDSDCSGLLASESESDDDDNIQYDNSEDGSDADGDGQNHDGNGSSSGGEDANIKIDDGRAGPHAVWGGKTNCCQTKEILQEREGVRANATAGPCPGESRCSSDCHQAQEHELQHQSVAKGHPATVPWG